MVSIIDFLVPKEKKFIKMLMIQSDILLQGAKEFNRFTSIFNKLDQQGIIEGRRAVKNIEHEGDRITRGIIDGLNDTFITPIDREDIFSLSQGMDDILDLIDDAAAKMLIYKIKKIPPEMAEFSKHIMECCAIIKNSMHHLKRYKEIKKATTAIHNIEHESDILFRRCIGELFGKKRSTQDIIKFKEVYESAEEAVDMCKKVGDIFGKIVVKHG